MSRIAKLTSTSGLALVVSLLVPAPTAAQTGAPAPTFSKDVLPIMQRSCQKCHRPGSNAPMSLLTYQDVRPWVRAIKQRVSARQMPPWHIDRSIGEYLDDPSLSDKEIETIVSWIDGGAPQGNPADAPPPLKFTAVDEWVFGEPDLVVRMEKGFTIPASGPDFTPSEVVDPGITEDRYVKWVQIIPDAHCCVHHSHVYVAAPEGRRRGGPRARHGIEHRQRSGSHRVRRGQRRRHLRGRHGEDDQGGVEVPLLARTTIPTARRCRIASGSASSSIRKATSRTTSSRPIGFEPTSAISGR